jgi:hypothetical protein
MVGDYISTSFGSDGLAHPVFVVANAPTAGGSDCATATPNCDVVGLYADDGPARRGRNRGGERPGALQRIGGRGRSAFKRR